MTSVAPHFLASSFLRLLVYLVIFLTAFVPRTLALDVYVAPDEGKWIYRSAHFLQAWLRGDLAQMTSVAATPEVEVLAPAVPTMWSGAVGLAAKYWVEGRSQAVTLTDYLKTIPEATEKIPLDFYPWTRFPTVLLTSLATLASYLLLSRLLGWEVALLTALLLALDPFFLGLSRLIHHDALVSIFIFLSVLTLLVYQQQQKNEPKRASTSLGRITENENVGQAFLPVQSTRSVESLLHYAIFKEVKPITWLAVSGVAGGLALLTKPTALYLVIFVALFLLLENGLPRHRSDWQRVMLEALGWGTVALVTFVLFWPALWVAPWATLTALLDRSASAVSENNNYALLPAPATPLPELGFLFYPVNWLFKSTLPVLIGLIALVVGVWQGWFTSERISELEHQHKNELVIHNSQFTIHNLSTFWTIKWLTFFTLLFLLLLIPADTRDIRYFLPATLALHALAAVGLTSHVSRLASPLLVIVLLLAFQLSLTVIYYPYYVDYLNPVVGGSWLAPRLVKIGSGEGLDQMGRYLDQKPNAKTLRVATSFWESFVPFFSGRYTKPHYDEEADYLIIYLRQIQNNNPFPEYWTYFSARQPEYQVSLVKVDYAWLYPGPQLRVVREADFGDGVVLQGYRLDRWAAQPGQIATLTLVWAGTTLAQANEQVTVQLADATGRLWAEAHGPLLDPAGPSAVEGHYRLNLPVDMPRGDYPVQVSLDNRSYRAGVIPVRQLDKLPVRYPASVNFGDVVVFGGADITPPSLPPLAGGGRGGVEMKLLWQARQPIPQSYTTFVHLVDADGNIWGQVDHIPGPGGSELPTNQWDMGEWIVDTFALALKPNMPAGNYTLVVGVYDSQTVERLPVVGGASNQTVIELTTITVP